MEEYISAAQRLSEEKQHKEIEDLLDKTRKDSLKERIKDAITECERVIKEDEYFISENGANKQVEDDIKMYHEKIGTLKMLYKTPIDKEDDEDVVRWAFNYGKLRTVYEIKQFMVDKNYYNAVYFTNYEVDKFMIDDAIQCAGDWAWLSFTIINLGLIGMIVVALGSTNGWWILLAFPKLILDYLVLAKIIRPLILHFVDKIYGVQPQPIEPLSCTPYLKGMAKGVLIASVIKSFTRRK